MKNTKLILLKDYSRLHVFDVKNCSVCIKYRRRLLYIYTIYSWAKKNLCRIQINCKSGLKTCTISLLFSYKYIFFINKML